MIGLMQTDEKTGQAGVEKFLFNIQNPESTVKEVAESAMREVVGKNDIQPILTAEAQIRINRAAHTADSGAQKLANYYVGQIVGTMNQRKTSGQVVYDMIEEFIDAPQALAPHLED